MTSQEASTDKLAAALAKDFPHFTFTAGELFYWSPKTKEIFYQATGPVSSILHELGHAVLDHQRFSSDVDLLHKEVAAWSKARELALRYRITITEEHVESCLDGYRAWLHARSTCPTCGSHGIQSSYEAYSCLNCSAMWDVSDSVLCRPYRQGRQALKAK